jgi:hypothetical protein
MRPRTPAFCLDQLGQALALIGCHVACIEMKTLVIAHAGLPVRVRPVATLAFVGIEEPGHYG